MDNKVIHYRTSNQSTVVTLTVSTKRVIHKTRSSRPEVFCKKGVLRNFAKFLRKHLCQSLFFNKVACGPASLKQRQHFVVLDVSGSTPTDAAISVVNLDQPWNSFSISRFVSFKSLITWPVIWYAWYISRFLFWSFIRGGFTSSKRLNKTAKARRRSNLRHGENKPWVLLWDS